MFFLKMPLILASGSPRRKELLSARPPPAGLHSAGLRAELRADHLPLGYSLGRSLQPCIINTCIRILLYVKKKWGMEEKPHTIKIYFCFLKKERK